MCGRIFAIQVLTGLRKCFFRTEMVQKKHTVFVTGSTGQKICRDFFLFRIFMSKVPGEPLYSTFRNSTPWILFVGIIVPLYLPPCGGSRLPSLLPRFRVARAFLARSTPFLPGTYRSRPWHHWHPGSQTLRHALSKYKAVGLGDTDGGGPAEERILRQF